MASPTTYFVVKFDNEASGPFVAKSTTELTWPGGGRGFIVTLIEDVDGANTGKMAVALIAGALPTNNQVLTQGSTTADTNGPAPNGDAEQMLYPAYERDDVQVAATGAITWTGPALGATHSFLFDGQTSNVVAGEILTFADGQKCEVVTVVSDAGASGELDVRWITAIDTLGLPDDNDTFTGDIAGDGTLNMVVHDRTYTPLHLHRLLADLSDDSIHAGNDVLSMIDATASDRSTDQIITLLGAVNINDTVAQHMYGGSVRQGTGAAETLYSGLALQVTDATGNSQPVVIANDAIVTNYWKNAYNPNSVAGVIRILQKTRENGVDIDNKRVRAKLLEYKDTYFFAFTTLGVGETSLALFSQSDNNNQTDSATVAGAPYNTIVITEGFQTIDYNNGNGATPFWLKWDIGSASRPQSYERWKYIGRRGTSETLVGRNAQLVTGADRNFAYDAESGGPFSEDEIIAFGTQLPYVADQALQVWQVDDDGGPSFVDQTAGFNDATDANFTPFPGTEAIGDYVAIGFAQKFNKVVFDNASASAVQGVGGVVVWEYATSATTWAALTGVTDGTTGFTATKSDGQVLTFTAPTTWPTVTLNGVAAKYIRARITTVYSTNPVYDQGFITGTFTMSEVVVGATSGARGRILYIDAATATTGTLVVAQDGTTNFSNAETITGQSGGGSVELGTVVTNTNAGKMLLLGLDDQGTTGNLYCQQLVGISPADNQKVFGATSLASADVNGAVSTRVINNNIVLGTFTGTAFQPNFGIGIDPSDGIADDLFVNLLGVNQQPPNNQTGSVTGGNAGDRLSVYPWDGSTLDVNGFPEQDFDEMTLDVALTAGVSTTVDVNAIPANTPAAGFLRIERDSDNEYDLVEYSSFTGSVFTLVGTAPSNASIGNNVFRALIDKVWATTGVPETYTAVQTTSNQVVITLRRGGVNPIKTFKGSATFGATGFSAAVQRTSDS